MKSSLVKMNKENAARCGAAGLRRSAIVERLRLREEWSALKEIPNETETRQNNGIKTRKQQNTNPAPKSHKKTVANKIINRCDKEVSDVLRGTVVLVEVGSEPRALPLRAALSALGASVMPTWSPLVTHVVWTQGGCRSTRAKARALACRLVSPLWVEACAAEGRRLPERIFPVAARPSDLPSPATLRRFLKKAEQENIPLQDLLSESVESDKRPLRLRLSSTDRDTTDNTNDTTNTTNNTTSDTNDTTDIEARVNTAPRRRAQDPVTKIPAKSKRKLFTQKEPELQTTDEESGNETTAGPKRMQPQRITQRNRKNLAKAERMAKRLVGACRHTQTNVVTQGTQINKPPKIVLTGMSRKERQDAFQAVQQLNGKVQQRVDRRTTHIVMGSCHEPDNTAQSPKTPAQTPKTSTRSPKTPAQSPLPMCKNCNSPGTILSKMFSANVTVDDCSSSTNNTNKNDRNLRCRCDCDISGIINLDSRSTQSFDILRKAGENGRVIDILGRRTENHQSDDILDPDTENGLNGDLGPERVSQVDSLPPNPTDGHNNSERVNRKPRTLNALLGAARGCRVLRLEWLKDSLKANRWLHHIGYEVRHLKKISRKARVERSALNKMRAEYAYDVFNGMRVRVSPDADQKDAITQLLTLCGAVIQDGGQPNVENIQNNKKSGKNVDNLQDGGKIAQNGAKITFSHLIARIRNQDGGKTSQNDRQMQDGGTVTADFDLTVGKGKGEVGSKWVFDSVAAARMRTTRRYINDIND